MVACGTAFYACLTAKYWFEKIARLPVEVDAEHYEDCLDADTQGVVFAIE